MSSDAVRIEDHGRVREIVIDRPEARNALDTAMFDALAAALEAADRDQAISCLLIRGADDHFSAGWDLGEAEHPPAPPQDGREHGYPALMTALEQLRKPIVAAVRGVAVGIGFTLLGHVDLVLVGRSARLRAPFAALGLCPEAGSSATFPALLGPQLTAELFYTGRWLGADEAVAAGLALRVVEDEELTDQARQLATAVADQPLVSLTTTKGLLRARIDEARQARIVEDLRFAELLRGPDHRAAVAKFMERSA